MNSANTAPFFRQQFFGPTGKPLTGGRIEFYSAGSATPKSVYSNRNMTTSLGNVLQFDDSGCPVHYFMASGEYDIKIFDQFNQLIDNPLRIDAEGGPSSPFPDPANPGFLHWDGSVYAWIEVPMYPTPGNSGYLHYDADTQTYSWTEVTPDDHKVANSDTDIPGYLKDKIVDSDTIRWSEIVVDGNSVVKADFIDLDKVPAVVVWAILDPTAPDTAPFGLSNEDIDVLINTGFGVAAQMEQSAFPSQLTIWYATGTNWQDVQWEAKAFITGSCITNLNKSQYDYLHTHPEQHPVMNDMSNYPAGIYSAVHPEGSDGRYWEPLLVQQYPDPSFNITSFLQYDATNKAFVWIAADSIGGKVKVSADDGTAEYLADKIFSDKPDYIAVENMDIGDPAHTHKMILRVKGANPLGPAGGDLFGSYPNPRVKELTGVPAMLTESVATFDWKYSGAWASGAGIGYGVGFVGGVEKPVWMSVSQQGELQISYDEWKTTVYVDPANTYYDTFEYTPQGETVPKTQPFNNLRAVSPFTNWRYASVACMVLPGSTSKWWVFSAEGKLAMVEVKPENFNANGSLKVEAIEEWSFTGIDPNTVTSNGETLIWTGNSTKIVYAKAADIYYDVKYISGHEVTPTPPSGYTVGVIGGNAWNGTEFLAVGRDSGILYSSTNGIDWTVKNVASVKYQDGTAMTHHSALEYAGALPTNTNPGSSPSWSANGNAWGGMAYLMNMWIVVNGKPAPTSLNTYWSPFLFSYDGVNWNAYAPTPDELGTNYSYQMYKIAFGHGKTFATNSDPMQAYKKQPSIYRLLVDEIPAHRKLVAEKGIDVLGVARLLDLPNATALGTNAEGEIIAVSGGGGGGFIRNQDENGTNDLPGNIFAAPDATWKIRYEDTGTPANNVDWFSVSKDMLKLQALDINNPALIGYQAELTPSALALRGRPGTSYGIYNAAAIISREAFNWIPNVNGAWYEFNFQDLGGGTAQAQGGYSFPRLKFRISDTDTVSAEMVHKIVDSNGAELAQVTNSTYGKALQIPTTIIAGTPNGQELFNYSAYELKSAIAQDGSGQGNNYGTRGFAFIALSSRLMTKGRMFVPQTGGQYMRFGIYDNQWKLLAKSARTAVFGGIIPFTLNIGYGGVAVAGAQLIGGERYYMAYWCDDTTANLKFGCITGRNTDSDDPQPQIFLDNQEMPDIMGTSGYRTALRPWMAVYEA